MDTNRSSTAGEAHRNAWRVICVALDQAEPTWRGRRASRLEAAAATIEHLAGQARELAVIRGVATANMVEAAPVRPERNEAEMFFGMTDEEAFGEMAFKPYFYQALAVGVGALVAIGCVVWFLCKWTPYGFGG